MSAMAPVAREICGICELIYGEHDGTELHRFARTGRYKEYEVSCSCRADEFGHPYRRDCPVHPSASEG